MKRRQYKKVMLENGFTLIELSIVILIIGLIVAGIVGGQAIVKQAKFKKIVSDVEGYKIAINAFYLEYNALPGDFPKAFNYWPTNCAAVPSAVNCNGNGNRNLAHNSGSNSNREQVRFWRHLGLAGIIPKLYSGTKNGGYGDTGESIIGVDVPNIVNDNYGIYAVHDTYNLVLSTSQFMFSVGTQVPGANPYHAAFTPKDAKSIDDKIDDGHPIEGKVFSGTAPGSTSFCINGVGGENVVNATDYVLSNENIVCRMIFLK